MGAFTSFQGKVAADMAGARSIMPHLLGLVQGGLIVLSRTLVSRRHVSGLVAVLCAVTGVCAFSSAAAQAELVHPFVSSFGSFAGVRGVAVNQSSGDVYVLDGGAGSVSKFDATGHALNFSSTGTNVVEGVGGAGHGENEIAVDSSSGPDQGDIYIANNSIVGIYSAAGVKLGELTGGGPEGAEACGVAVDPAGEVYVGFYGSTVNRYTPVSNPVSNADKAGSMGGLNNICNVAADGAGDVYAATYSGGVSKYEALQFGSPAATGTAIDGRGRTLAVDPATDDVYINEASGIAEYDSSGNLIGVSGAGSLSESDGVAIKGGGSLYAADGSGHVDIFAATAVVQPDVTTQPASAITQSMATLHGTVNPDGVPVSTCRFEYRTEAETSYGHTAACSPAPGSGAAPVAVSAELSGLTANTVYRVRLAATNANGTSHGEDSTFTTLGPPTVASESSEGITHMGATLAAQIVPDGYDTHYHFEYGPSTAYGSSAPVPAGDLGSGSTEQSASVQIGGLEVGGTYHFRVVASNEVGSINGPDQTFTTLPAALIDSTSVSDVSPTSAKLRAQVNPLGTDTSVYFQYGSSNCAVAGSSCADAPAAPGTDIGAGESDTETAVPIQGLAAGTTYHYRAVATNALGRSDGPDRTFTTNASAGGSGLPDGRAWELASPPDKQAAQLLPPRDEGGIIQAAEDGHAITYLANAPIVLNPPSNPTETQIFSERTSAGWSSQDISPPGERSIRVGLGLAHRAFSSDLSLAIVEPLHDPLLLAPEVPSELTVETYSYDTHTGTYRPLVTSLPVLQLPSTERMALEYNGASRDAKHVVFSSYLALTPGSVEVSRENFGSNLFEWTDGSLKLVNVLPDGSPTAGRASLPIRNAVSEDGAHVVWSFASGAALYVRNMVTQTTVQVDASQGGSGAGGEGQFQTASADDSRVFFTDRQQLTPDATTHGNGNDLYEFDTLTGALTDMTPDAVDPEGAQTRLVIGASDSGGTVYFVARGVLAAGATAGAENLYVAHDDGSSWTPSFIATLSEEDQPGSSARVSPNGGYVAFMSKEPLTGYDNRDASSGLRDEEVFVYDAQAKHLVCASCNPSGEGPSGALLRFEPLIDSTGVWYGKSVAALIPPFTNMTLGTGTYQPRYLSDSGRLFFDSVGALVPHDSNGQPDVYEYEPEGVGDCSASTASTSTLFVREVAGSSVNGCIGLISSGTSDEESTFLDASGGGGDAFFLTSNKLSSRDVDGVSDVYDARECTSASPCLAQPAAQPPDCTTVEACRTAPSPQPSVFGSPPSATFTGAGNVAGAPVSRQTAAKSKSKPLTRSQKLAKALRACKRKPAKQRARCKAQASRRYGSAKGKARSSDGRGKAKQADRRAGR